MISMCLSLKNKQYVTLFTVYTPTLQAEPTEKDKFHLELHSCLQSTSADNKVIILGDFNARVSEDADSWKGVLGRHSIGNCNDNGCLLLELCTEQQIVITNTIFRLKDRLKTTWMHPRSKHWHLIDYDPVHKCDLKDIIHTKVMPSAECHTDHHLVRCKLRLHFKPKSRKGEPPPRKSSMWTNFSWLKWKLTFRQAYCPSLKTATTQKSLLKHSGINWRVPSCRHQKKFLDLQPKRTKTGSTSTTKRFRNCRWKRDHPTWFNRHVLWGGLPSISFAASFSISFERSKMSGGQILQRELSNIQT